MKNKQAMTLIEVMIAISLLILATSAIGWKMHGMMAKKRFTSSVEKLRSRLLTTRRMAINMQCDWKADIEYRGKKGFFRVSCSDNPGVIDFPVLALDALELTWEGKKVETLSFDFTASGEILPRGHLQIRSGDVGAVDWDLPDLFSLSEGDKLGPIHPSLCYEQCGKL